MDEVVMKDSHPCPLCSGFQRILLYKTRDRHYKISGEWNVTRCGDCDLVQLSPMPTSNELMKLYPEEFYAYSPNRHKKLLTDIIKKIFFPTLVVKDPKMKTPGKILDYGCGTGWSLLKFKKLGWECYGMEPDDKASKVGREQLGLRVLTGTIHTIKNFNEKQFDYIRTNHALEHDPDIAETIEKFRDIISPNGKLLIGVPNIDSIPAKIFKKYWWYLGAPVHTYNYSVDTLSAILNKYDFTVERVRYCGNFTGILGSIQIYLNRDKPHLSSQEGFVFRFLPFKIITQLLAGIINQFKQGDAIEITAKPVIRNQ